MWNLYSLIKLLLSNSQINPVNKIKYLKNKNVKHSTNTDYWQKNFKLLEFQSIKASPQSKTSGILILWICHTSWFFTVNQQKYKLNPDWIFSYVCNEFQLQSNLIYTLSTGFRKCFANCRQNLTESISYVQNATAPCQLFANADDQNQ